MDVINPWIFKDIEGNSMDPNSDLLAEGMPSIVRNAITSVALSDQTKPSVQTTHQAPNNQPEEGTVFLMWFDESLSPEAQEIKFNNLPLKTHVYLAAYFDFNTPDKLKEALKSAYKYILQHGILCENEPMLKGRYAVIIGKMINIEDKLKFEI